MARGAFHHALIIPAKLLSVQTKKPGNEAKGLRRGALYDSEDLARHLANYVMNQIPTLSISHISSKDIITPDIWSDPFRVYACLFAKSSRILFLVTQQDVDAFSEFITQLLQPLLKQAELLDYKWKSRFLVVAMGEFRLPETLPCEVIRFREIGWFRDSIALFILGKKIQEFWTPLDDPSDSIAKTEKLRFVTNVEETETFRAAMCVKNIIDENITLMQTNDGEKDSVYEHESTPEEGENVPFATSQNFSFHIDIESEHLIDINELLFVNKSLSALHGIIQPYSADFRCFSSRSEIGFTGSSNDSEDEPLVSDEARSMSDSVGEMRWSPPDSVSIVQKADVSTLSSPNNGRYTIVTDDQEDTSTTGFIGEPKIEAPKAAKRKPNGSSLIKEHQTVSSDLESKDCEKSRLTEQSPAVIRKPLADIPLKAIQELSAEEDGTAYQSFSEIQRSAEFSRSTESDTKHSKWRTFSSSDAPIKESTGHQLELESPYLDEGAEKSGNYSAELMKLSPNHSNLPPSITEVIDEVTRLDKQKLFITNDKTSGYNTMTSTGGRISHSGKSTLDQLSFHSPREETTISEEPESISLSPVSYLPKRDRRGVNTDRKNQSLVDYEIRTNGSSSLKISETIITSVKSKLGLQTDAGDCSRKQETLTSLSVQADILAQVGDSKTDTFTTVTNLDDECLSDTYTEKLKHGPAVSNSSELIKKSDSIGAPPDPVITDTEFGIIEESSIMEMALPENENKDNSTSEWFTSTSSDNPLILEGISEILPEAGSIIEEGRSSVIHVITKDEVSDLLPIEHENASAGQTQAVFEKSSEHNIKEGIPPKEIIQLAKSEPIPEESKIKDSKSPPSAKNTSENEINQRSDVKIDKSMPAEINEVANLASTADSNIQNAVSVTTASKSVIDLINQEISERSSKMDPISTTKQLIALDGASITSSTRTNAESRPRDTKGTVLITGAFTSIEKNTALRGENGKEISKKPKETSLVLNTEMNRIVSSKENTDVCKKGASVNETLGNTGPTKVAVPESNLPQDIHEDIPQTVSDKMKNGEEKSRAEITSNAPDINLPIMPMEKIERVLRDKKNESNLNIPLEHGTSGTIETGPPTSSSSAGDELSKSAAKLNGKGASTLMKMKSSTGGDADYKTSKSEHLQQEEEENQEEKKKTSAGSQAKLHDIKTKNNINIPTARGIINFGVDMAKERNLKEETPTNKDMVERLKPKSNGILLSENALHSLTDALKHETASVSSDKKSERVVFKGSATKSTRMVEQSSCYSPVNEETIQQLAKNIPFHFENSDREYTAVPLRQLSAETTSLPLIYIQKSTVEETTEVTESKTWQTNNEPMSKISENRTSVEKSNINRVQQPATVTIKLNTKGGLPEPGKHTGNQEITSTMTKPPITNTTPIDSPWEELEVVSDKDNRKSKEEMKIAKDFDIFDKNGVESARLGIFPMPCKCSSPFTDSDCDPEITSYTMARPWHLLDSGDISQPHVPSVFAPRTKNATEKSSSLSDKNDQKGNSQPSKLTPKFYPASVAETAKIEVTQLLRRNSEELKAKAEHRFSSISISDGEDQKPVEFVDVGTGSNSARLQFRSIPGPTPITLFHETGEYKRNLSTQVSKNDKNQGSVTHGAYYRQLAEVAKQPSEALKTYWRDRGVGSPTRLEFSVGSDIMSDLSVTSEISSISSKGESRDQTVNALLSVYKALGKASKILADSNKAILKQVELLKKN